MWLQSIIWQTPLRPVYTWQCDIIMPIIDSQARLVYTWECDIMPHNWQSSKTHLHLRVKFFFLFFSFSGDDCISGYHLKKDDSINGNKLLENSQYSTKPGRKTCLKLLGTCLNLEKLLFGGGDQNLANFFFKNVWKEYSSLNFFGLKCCISLPKIK